MRSIAQFRKPPSFTPLASCAGFAGFIFCASCLWAAGPLLSKPDAGAVSVHPAAKSVSTVPTPPPTYYVKIAECRKNDKDSDDDTEQLSRFLDAYKNWRGDVKLSPKRFLDLRTNCEDNNLYCDVVSISEELTADEMILRVHVYTTPEAHRNSHASPQSENSLPCKLRGADEQFCRETLMKSVVKELAGLDKIHPSHEKGN